MSHEVFNDVHHGHIKQKNIKNVDKNVRKKCNLLFDNIDRHNDGSYGTINGHSNYRNYKTRIFWNSNYKHKVYDGVSNMNNTLNCISERKYKKCDDPRCKTCPMANNGQLNDYSNRTFCKVYNCIYMLRCKTCDLKYVGQTANTINIRINQHRHDSKVYKPKNTTINNRIEIGHFNMHGFNNVEINILKIIPNGKRRLWFENNLMHNKNTLYPYGLNAMYFDKVITNMRFSNDYIYSYINNNIKDKKLIRNRDKNRKKRKVMNNEALINKLNILHKCYLQSYDYNNIKRFMFGLNKK